MDKDLYRILIDTRNLEIKLFWERSNYFLALNSGIALAFFTIGSKGPRAYTLLFGVIGFLTSLLWFLVCLGGKYWQSRWEQRLQDFEKQYEPDLAFFGADLNRARADALRGVASQNLGPFQRWTYQLACRLKPSVSYSMIRLSELFIVGWLALLIVGLSS